MSDVPAKIALVTGGATRIGRVLALALAQRGWDIALHYRNSYAQAQQTASDITSLGRRCALVQAELGDVAQVQKMIPQIQQQLGQVHCIINNASLFEEDCATAFSPTLLDKHMQANVAAPLLLAQALHAQLPQDAHGVVVNLLDQKLYNLNPDYLSYTLSKAALQTATTLLAQALAPKVRVVGVAPGLTLVSGHQTEENFATAHQMTPLGRSSTPEDIADAVCFAVQSPAMTGTTLLIDGGQHLIPLQRDVMYVAK